MENASKALIIAGAILVAILIVSLAVYIFNDFSNSAKNMSNLDEQEISAFNSKLLEYMGSSISGSQVNALLQYCLSNNMSASQSGETYKYITVTITTKSNGTSTVDGNSSSYKKVPTGVYYTVSGTYDPDTGLLTTITGKYN